MGRHRTLRVATIVVIAGGLVLVAGWQADARRDTAPASARGDSRSTPPTVAFDDETRRVLDSLAVWRDSVLGSQRIAVLPVGVAEREVTLRVLRGRSASRDTVLLRVVRGADTIRLTTSGATARVRAPALLLPGPQAMQFSVAADDPSQPVELRAESRRRGAADRRRLWSGRIAGWRLVLRRTGPEGEFVPLADVVELPGRDVPSGTPRP